MPIEHLRKGSSESRGLLDWPMRDPWTTAVVCVVVVAVAVGVFLRRRASTLVCAATVVSVFAVAVQMCLTWMPRYGPTSDRAVALEVGWRALVAGEYPFDHVTQLGNPIAPMFGGLMLAGPFIEVMGSLWWYGLLWFAVTLCVVWLVGGPGASAAVAVLLLTTTAFRIDLASQSDSWINALYLVLFGSAGFVLVGRGGGERRGPRGWRTAVVAVAVLFGMAVAYRFIYAPAALPLVAVMWRRYGWRRTAWFAAPAGVVALVLVVAPWAVAPQEYAPLQIDHVAGDVVFPVVPHLSALLAAGTLGVFVAGSVIARSLVGVWATAAAALSTMIVILAFGRNLIITYETVAYDGAVLVFAFAALTASAASRRLRGV